MDNRNHRVFYSSSICFVLYLGISVAMSAFNKGWEPFDRINLISEIIKSHQKNTPAPLSFKKDVAIAKKQTENPSEKTDFELYRKPQLITNFRTGNNAALPGFMQKLQELKQGKKIKLRIAYFGDSMIEGDLLTQTFRKLLQQEYGGEGVGFLPISSNVSGFRQTATSYAAHWEDISFMTKGAENLYLSGHYFMGKGTGVYRDNTLKNPETLIEKSLIYKKTKAGNIGYNGRVFPLETSTTVTRKVLSKDRNHEIRIASLDSATVYYGLSFESETGVFVDNFSFRGITGVELNKLQENFLKEIEKANPYDLIILQYGVNLLFRPGNTDYEQYSRSMAPVLKKLKAAFPNSEFLLISSADRAFNYDGNFKTAIGLPNLLETQALLAFENNYAFYNQFETMGGTNSIVRWAEQNPALANKDYIHPNAKGAEILAEKLFEALQNDFKKYSTKKK